MKFAYWSMLFLISFASFFQQQYSWSRQSGLVPTRRNSRIFMGSEFERPDSVKIPVKDPETEVKVKSTSELEKDGNGLSQSMKDKLRREIQAQGGDPNYSAGPIKGNPILIVSGIVAILVILGGKGFFY